MPKEDNELQDRICRACNETYRYPVPRSGATRFHCETCAELPTATRGVLEKFNKRIKALTQQVEKLRSTSSSDTNQA